MALPLLDDRQFGLIIAYVIPGMLVAHGLSEVSPTLAVWMGIEAEPGFAGFLYVFLLATLFGLVLSTIRWLTVDRLHARFGLKPDSWELEELAERLPALEMLVLYNYRYYQFYSNTLVALPIWLILHADFRINPLAIAIISLLEVVLFAGSRDTLRNYVRHARSMRKSRLQIVEPC